MVSLKLHLVRVGTVKTVCLNVRHLLVKPKLQVVNIQCFLLDNQVTGKDHGTTTLSHHHHRGTTLVGSIRTQQLSMPDA